MNIEIYSSAHSYNYLYLADISDPNNPDAKPSRLNLTLVLHRASMESCWMECLFTPTKSIL